ncbi:MAG: PIN domain-containing protein [Cyanobacteria bacterium P01_D01_bin.1]
MTDAAWQIIRRYSSKGVLIDTNILLLYFIGAFNRERIERFKRTKQFTARDYDLLIGFINQFRVVATTPNILTEVNSLINQLGEPDRSNCYLLFASEVEFFQETYLRSQEVVSTDWSFQRYGLTDCGTAKLASNRYLVLTDDLKLTRYLNSLGVDTLNFNNLKD